MAKEILHADTCSLCSEKLTFAEKSYTHILSDGTLCQKCHMTLLQLLSQRRWWVDDDTYSQAMQAAYSHRKAHCLPLEKARTLLTLRNASCNAFLQTVELETGCVFVTQETFAMPKSPAIFILRAMKLKNKRVLQGFPLKGEIRKGDPVRLKLDGKIHAFTALDVISSGTEPLEKATFFDLLSTNVHRHRLPEGQQGWIILDTEACEDIPTGSFAAIEK